MVQGPATCIVILTPPDWLRSSATMFVNIYTYVFVAIDPICAVSLITIRRLRFHCCLQVRSGVNLASKLFSIFQ